MNDHIQKAKQSGAQNQSMVTTLCIGLLLLSLTGISISLLLGIKLSRSISKPIKEAAVAAESFAKGLLSARIHYDSNDKIGVLSKAMNHAFEELQNIIRTISHVLASMERGDLTAGQLNFSGDFKPVSDAVNSIFKSLNKIFSSFQTIAENVDSEAGHLSEGVQAIAKGASEQASAVEQLLASIEQVSTAARQNSKEIEETTERLDIISQKIGSDNTQMSNMVSAVNEISRSSQEIEKIIQLINNISFQTNILALNAAVEAARAGEAGKGFAVVAGEVRRLAVQAADSAMQISQWIGSSAEKVEEGLKIASDTALSLQETSKEIEAIYRSAKNVDESIQEQTSTFQEIFQCVQQISQVVQKNSFVSEQEAAASGQLSVHSNLLAKQLSSIILREENKIIPLRKKGAELISTTN